MPGVTRTRLAPREEAAPRAAAVWVRTRLRRISDAEREWMATEKRDALRYGRMCTSGRPMTSGPHRQYHYVHALVAEEAGGMRAPTAEKTSWMMGT